MIITQDTKNRARNLELGGGLESGDGGDCVIGVQELEEQVTAKAGGTQLRSTARRSKLVVKNRQRSPSRSTSYTLSKFDFTCTRHEQHPLSIFRFIFISFFRNSLLPHTLAVFVVGSVLVFCYDLRPTSVYITPRNTTCRRNGT